MNVNLTRLRCAPRYGPSQAQPGAPVKRPHAAEPPDSELRVPPAQRCQPHLANPHRATVEPEPQRQSQSVRPEQLAGGGAFASVVETPALNSARAGRIRSVTTNKSTVELSLEPWRRSVPVAAGDTPEMRVWVNSSLHVPASRGPAYPADGRNRPGRTEGSSSPSPSGTDPGTTHSTGRSSAR